MLAHQVLLGGEFAVEPLEAGLELVLGDGLGFLGHGGVEQGAEALVHLGADEGQPFLQAVARHGAVGGREVLGGGEVGNVLHDGRAFAQAGAVVELEHRHVAQRVDAVVVGAVLQLVALGAGQHGLEGDARFVQRDVGGERAGAGRVVQLHSKKLQWIEGKDLCDRRGC
ncbi:hypothetical protein D3C72_1481110 [compost metagenome]